MADISQDDLKKEITAILKDADLNTLSAKKVRQQIEEKLDVDLTSKKKIIDKLVMECLQDKKSKAKGSKKNGNKSDGDDDDEGEDDAEEDEEEDEDEEDEDEKPKRAAKKPTPKRKKASSDESDDASEEDKDDDYSPSKKKAKAPKKATKKARKPKGSDSDSDEDWGKKKKTAKKGAGGGGKGYTKPLKLSSELSELMGQDCMPRHEVVKRIWAYIKENNLYDPKNKQFAICNDELFKVFGVKRFRTFGMMKLLKDHFVV